MKRILGLFYNNLLVKFVGIKILNIKEILLIVKKELKSN